VRLSAAVANGLNRIIGGIVIGTTCRRLIGIFRPE
jgi:hypothetical protein